MQRQIVPYQQVLVLQPMSALVVQVRMAVHQFQLVVAQLHIPTVGLHQRG